MDVGKVHPATVAFLRQQIGSEPTSDGAAYECSLANMAIPLVRSSRTGKSFTLPWEDIVRLAIDAGIDEVDEVTVECQLNEGAQ